MADELTGYALDLHRMTTRAQRRRAVGMFAILQAVKQGGGQWTRDHVEEWARIYAHECDEDLTPQGFAAWLREVEVVKGWVAAAWDGERWLWRLTPLGQYVLDLLRGMGGAGAAMAAQEAAS